MPFAAAWMQPQIIMLSEVSQKEKDKYYYNITYMWNLKYDTNELIYETETDSQTYRTDLRFLVVGEGGIGGLGLADANCYTQNE